MVVTRLNINSLLTLHYLILKIKASLLSRSAKLIFCSGLIGEFKLLHKQHHWDELRCDKHQDACHLIVITLTDVILAAYQQTLGALRLGIKHGSYHLGCCWFLMTSLFVTGVMNLTWILILTFFVLIEKSAPKGKVLSKILDACLILWFKLSPGP